MTKEKVNFYLFASVAAVNLLSISAGGAYAWSSPVIPKLTADDPNINPLGGPITVSEESLIGSLVSLGATIGAFMAPITAEKFGRRKALLYFSTAFVISHLMFAFGRIVELYFIARFLMGIGAGAVFSSLPSFVGEISEDFNRGLMGSVMSISISIGAVATYGVGPFVSMRTFSLINLIPLVIFYPLVIMLVPESPYFFTSITDEASAENSLRRLRVSSLVAQKKELTYIKEFLMEQRVNKPSFKELIKSRAVIRGLKIACGVMLFQQLSGVSPIIGFLETIFEESGASLSPRYSVIIVAIVQLVVNIFVSYVVDKLGRKILLIMSSFGCMLSAASLGTFFFLKNNGNDVTSLNWLPIASLILFILSYNLGLGPVAWTVVGEVFSSNIKSLATCISTVTCMFAAFLITVVYPYMVDSWGMAATFWFFSGCSVVGFVFALLVIPETKGRSLKEIQDLLSR